MPAGRPATPARRVAIPRRAQGCTRQARRGTYIVAFNAALGPDGLTVGGPPRAELSIQVGNYPWDRNARYNGAATYPIDFVLDPRRTAKSWEFRADGKRRWDQTVKTSTGGATVTINADERSGSFSLGPYTDPKGQAWTVRGSFTCTRLMAAAGL